MPLTEEIAIEAKKHYEREYDRYAKLASLIALTCERLIQDAGVPAVVQHRAKSPDSFLKKLKKYINEDNQDKINKVTKPLDALDMVGDLAGVRVATYVEADRPRVVEIICSKFRGPNKDGSVDVDEKEKANGYRATHCQVILPEEMAGSPDNFNIVKTSAEIQVCSMLAHVWNEIEHDIRYKVSAPWGEDEAFRDQKLQEFHNAIEQGDSIIEELLSLSSEKQACALLEEKELLEKLEELRDYNKKNASDVLKEIVRLGYTDSSKIITAFLHDGWLEEGRGLIKDINHNFDINNVNVRLNVHNADVLLALVLKKHSKDILALHKRDLEEGEPLSLAEDDPLRVAKIARQLAFISGQ